VGGRADVFQLFTFIKWYRPTEERPELEKLASKNVESDHVDFCMTMFSRLGC